jgi:hypothetical protein
MIGLHIERRYEAALIPLQVRRMIGRLKSYNGVRRATAWPAQRSGTKSIDGAAVNVFHDANSLGGGMCRWRSGKAHA